MTTIAYKDGVIAYDSRSCRGAEISTDNYDKHKISQGVHFFISGAVSDEDSFIAAYHAKENPEQVRECAAIVIDSGRVFCVGANDDDGMFRTPLDQFEIYAIGSGTDHAFTAMDMGASAREAVKMAAKRDCHTGGRIRTFKVNKKAPTKPAITL